MTLAHRLGAILGHPVTVVALLVVAGLAVWGGVLLLLRLVGG